MARTRTQNALTLSLAKTDPDLASEWHPTKNGKLKASSVKRSEPIAVWWLCKVHDHAWKCLIATRVYQKGKCPKCAYSKQFKSLQDAFPKIAKEWHPDKNGDLLPLSIAAGSSKRAWFICKKKHEWEATISSRTRSNGTGCPFCSGHKVSAEASLAARFPDDKN